MLSGVASPQPDVDVTTFDHVRNPIGELNECWVQHLRGETGADVLDAVPRRHRRAPSDADRHDRGGLERGHRDASRAGHLRPVHAGPDLRLLDARAGRPRRRCRVPASDAELDSPAARLALDEITASMGFVVGKLGKAPDGSRVAIELTGPMARAIRVAVDGRAAVVDDFGRGADRDDPAGRPAVHPASRWAPGADRPVDGVEFGGDAEVGQRIVDQPGVRDLTGTCVNRWTGVEWHGMMDCPAEVRRGCEGLNGFDFAHRIKGSVPVQARDHRKRRCNQLSADSNQRDYALAA